MKKTNLIGLFSAALFTLPAFAAWQVDNQQSRLSIVSVKNAAVTEVHHFQRLEGGLMDSGEFSLSIDLASISSGIEIRDTRMRELLFNVADFPRAVVSARVTPALYQSLKAGQSVATDIDFTINLHGQVGNMSAAVLVTALENGGLQVVTQQPLVLRASEFGLDAGIDALRDIAGLKNINTMVPVSFHLTLQPQ
ncbi:YceI family protein [Bowmanella sp. JS7-9]|uniref:YceI family protein n=1 Tax=Pseudobowmanella zhangzhouensis TaxID=1537679 RepID=A0ABW1XGN6_9ALTE|nr:YceI family protein [Bowmanella sp. JS7-9]TBX20906.1 hypothetical protein TK45_14175 [Bowmanella sp. JS7-9]